MNKTSFNYITKCEIFFCILAVNPNGSYIDYRAQLLTYNIECAAVNRTVKFIVLQH
jgi:hypothetical protein